MEQLIQQLMNGADLNREQAEKTIAIITEFIKSKLPPMMQGVVGDFIADSPDEDDVH